MTPQVIRLKDIATTPAKTGILPVSPATIWRWVSTGKFPKPFKIGASVTVWKMSDVENFIAKHSAMVA